MKRRKFLLAALSLPIVMQLPLQQDWEVVGPWHINKEYTLKKATRNISPYIKKGSIFLFKEVKNS